MNRESVESRADIKREARLTALTINGGHKNVCPKCGADMEYIIEKERLGNGEVRIRMYYKCPVCGTIIVDQKIVIVKTNGHVKALVEEPGQVIMRRRSVKKVTIMKKLKALGFLK